METETLHQSLSLVGMFKDSDLFMQVLMMGLIFASIWCWTIIFDKLCLFRKIRTSMKDFETKFWSGGSLDSLYTTYAKTTKNPLANIFVAAIQEWRRSTKENKGKKATIKLSERIDKVMQIAIDKQVDKMETRMTFLASTGSVAPLLGLLGTVYGIMDAFSSIGAMQTTSIAAVAPGVAEALLTTAVGLIAAIPAVIAYNKLTNDIDRMAQRMETFAGELGAILSRQAETNAEE
ncbi:MAG: protein TolQ [Alphaproteobacteria bacterium]|nr:protein TolQ [Alphaproteobacteria bacterium]